MDLIKAADRLARQVNKLTFADPVTHVYNPLQYAKSLNHDYLKRFGQGKKRAVFLGMNPGPWGMAQTGVPFGDVQMVRDWLKLEGQVKQPKVIHPKRPVQGLQCPRSEVSGTRLWGAVAEHYKTPDKFFRQFFVANYCPLSFMAESGRNITPDKLPAEERRALFAHCDQHLRTMIEILNPEWVIGVGAFAEKKAQTVLSDYDLRFGRILHPSPASPAANRGWAAVAKKQMKELGFCSSGASSK
jgi:single-strand selective monofunctional uracil DNA glycosylase